MCTRIFPVSSSVTDAVTVITPEDATNTTYSITVTCTIDPYSTADMCEVMATANSQTLTGNEYEYILPDIIHILYTYTYISIPEKDNITPYSILDKLVLYF